MKKEKLKSILGGILFGLAVVLIVGIVIYAII